MAKKTKQQTPTSFTFYDGFATAIEQLPNNQLRALFVWDFYRYGSWGVEPTFDWAKDPMVKMAVQMAWDIALPSLDKSIQNHKNGKKGGRPKKSKPKTDDTITVATDLNVDISGETLTQAAWAAEQLYEPIPDEVIAMIEPACKDVEVF